MSETPEVPTKKNPLQLKAAKTLRFYKRENLLTDEHALLEELILFLAAEWSECQTSNQRAAISKELRAAIEMLPKIEKSVSDEAEEFLSDLLSEDDN